MKQVLVVGSGLAGICLSTELVRRGCHVTLVDNGVNHSSAVAAGMINPLVFRRMTKSWRVDAFLPYAVQFYKELEQATDSSFFHSITIRRFFSSKQEREFWEERQHTPAFGPYMTELNNEDATIHPYANLYGSGRVRQSAYVDTHTFLDASKHWLSKHVQFLHEAFEYPELNERTGEYKANRYDAVLFAEGYLGVNNPWFSHLPLQQTKGETLTVRLAQLETEESLNRKCFMLPLGNQTFKVGSTYVWSTDDLSITDQGREQILQNLHFLTDETPQVLEQQAGIRPTTPDRRPLLGTHPQFERLYYFNGLGTKGYMMAPLLAKELTDLLLDGIPIPEEYNLSRFTKS